MRVPSRGVEKCAETSVRADLCFAVRTSTLTQRTPFFQMAYRIRDGTQVSFLWSRRGWSSSCEETTGWRLTGSKKSGISEMASRILLARLVRPGSRPVGRVFDESTGVYAGKKSLPEQAPRAHATAKPTPPSCSALNTLQLAIPLIRSASACTLTGSAFCFDQRVNRWAGLLGVRCGLASATLLSRLKHRCYLCCK